jgi:hypothetical protein
METIEVNYLLKNYDQARNPLAARLNAVRLIANSRQLEMFVPYASRNGRRRVEPASKIMG